MAHACSSISSRIFAIYGRPNVAALRKDPLWRGFGATPNGCGYLTVSGPAYRLNLVAACTIALRLLRGGRFQAYKRIYWAQDQLP